MGIFDPQQGVPQQQAPQQQQPNPYTNTPFGMQNYANAANVFLQQYGMQEPTDSQVNPYLFFGNSGYLGQHPGLARGIDAGLSGLAFTAPSRTIGEGMSNVAQGIMNARNAHIQNIVGQYQRPVQMAEQLQGLQAAQTKIGLEQAQTGYYSDKAAATRPVIDSWSGISYTFDPASGKWVKEAPAPGQITHGTAQEYTADQRRAAQENAANIRSQGQAPGKTLAERIAYDQQADEVGRGGTPWTPGQHATRVQSIASQLAGAAANAGKVGSNLGNLSTGGMSETDKLSFETDRSEAQRKKLPPPSTDYGKRIMEDMTAQEAGFKDAQDMVDKTNVAADEELYQKHPQMRPGAKPIQTAPVKSKPKAVAPKSSNRPPLAKFEQ